MKNLQKSQPVAKEVHQVITRRLQVISILRKCTAFRDWLALLIIVPFVIAYLGFTVKALLIVTTGAELSQVAQTLLFPLPLITIITLILGYYFKRNHNNDDEKKP